MKITLGLALFFLATIGFAQAEKTKDSKMKEPAAATDNMENSEAKEADKAEMADAANITCTSGDDVRTIVITYSTPGEKLPCSVDYTKSGETKSLWNSSSQEGYCEEKATYLSDKLQASGYDCK